MRWGVGVVEDITRELIVGVAIELWYQYDTLISRRRIDLALMPCSQRRRTG